MNVETTTQAKDAMKTEEGRLIVEQTLVQADDGQTRSTLAGIELLGPGAGVGYPWDRFRYPQGDPPGGRAWVRYLWQRGGVVAQLLGVNNGASPKFWAGWQLSRMVPGFSFLAVFQNGPITARSARAKIFMVLYSGHRVVGYSSIDAHSGYQPLRINLPGETPVSRIIVGANCEMNHAPANAYAEVIANDIKVFRYSHSAHGLAKDQAEEVELEKMLSDLSAVHLSPLSEEEKASGDWIGFTSEEE